eukprot:jgi/Bigna1/67266/fgenesh1_pg.3_\
MPPYDADERRRRKKKKKKKREKTRSKQRQGLSSLSFGGDEDEEDGSFQFKTKPIRTSNDGGLAFIRSSARMSEEEALSSNAHPKDGEDTQDGANNDSVPAGGAEDDGSSREKKDEATSKSVATTESKESKDGAAAGAQQGEEEGDYKKYMTYFKKPKIPHEQDESKANTTMAGFTQAETTPTVRSDPVKILVCGDVRGQFNVLFARAKKFQERVGPFEALFCVGDFFAPSEDGHVEELRPYLEGTKNIPIPTYFIGGKETGEAATELLRMRSVGSDDSEGGGKTEKKEMNEKTTAQPARVLKLAENLSFLGRQGRVDIAGLSVAFLSGRFSPEYFMNPPDYEEHLKPYNTWYCDDHLDDLLDNAGGDPDIVPANSPLRKGVDLLLTSEWPQFDEKFPLPDLPESLSTPEARETLGSPAVGALVGGIATRYHFVGSHDLYYTLSPYRNRVHSTRFYALAGIGNKEKQKSMKAFSIVNKFNKINVNVPVASMADSELKTMHKEAEANPFDADEKKEEEASSSGAGGGEDGGKGTTGPKAAPTVSRAPEGEKNASVFHNGLLKVHEVYEDGRWKCAFCGNVNYARQNKQCNMRKCQAPAPPCLRKEKTQPKESSDEVKKPVATKRKKKDSIYYAQRPKKRRGPKNE